MIAHISGASYASVLIIGLLCFARLARAGDGANGDPRASANGAEAGAPEGDSERARVRALELFQQSSALYEQGDFRESVALLERAYSLFPEPILLYNIGRAHEGLGEDDDAIAAYEKYLATQADAKDRGAITRRLQTLKERVDERRPRVMVRRASCSRRRSTPRTACRITCW